MLLFASFQLLKQYRVKFSKLSESSKIALQKIYNGTTHLPYIDRRQLVEQGFVEGDPMTERLSIRAEMKWVVKRLLKEWR